MTMKNKIALLDCTLRDGCYIVSAKFGKPAITGIIKKLQAAGVEIIECGWLKNAPHEEGSAFYHVPQDLEKYIGEKDPNVTYSVMIDWDRYDLDNLPVRDGKSVDVIRVVFPHEKYREGIQVGCEIKKKGYKVFFQAANTLAYTDEELVDLAAAINEADPVSLSVVDTFGAMYAEDLERIVGVLDAHLAPHIKLGFHSHNNQQMAFALTTDFIRILAGSERSIVVDASLCGMGRGAGNATTELVVSYLNKKCGRSYDMDAVMDAIDMYMGYFKENYQWGYSTPYFIAGMYCCHVNNIAYLLQNHRTNARDMRNIIESMAPTDRRKYDYDLLEEKYIQNQSRKVDDEGAMDQLSKALAGRPVLLIAPGMPTITCQEKINEYIQEKEPVVIDVNAVNDRYRADYLFFINSVRYEYARDIYPGQFTGAKKIILSNVKTEGGEGEYIVNFSRVNKNGWEFFDNAVIDCLRLLDRLRVKKVTVAGFDGFGACYNETYADKALPILDPDSDLKKLNAEIKEMFHDFRDTAENVETVEFLTESIFNENDVLEK